MFRLATPFEDSDAGFGLFETQLRPWHAGQCRDMLTGANNMLTGAGQLLKLVRQ